MDDIPGEFRPQPADSTDYKEAKKMGGWTGPGPAYQTTQNMLNSMRTSIETQIGKQLSELTAVLQRTQVVAGTNYRNKARVGKDEYIHVSIFQSFTGETELGRASTGKSYDDEL